jgi:putative hydrolase of the HAD superfamily
MIFFDIDGTLIDHRSAERAGAIAFQKDHIESFPEPANVFIDRWHALAAKYLPRYLAGEISFQDQRRARIRDLFTHLQPLSDSEADRIFAGYLKRYEDHWSLYPDVMPCLKEMDNQRLGIISNGESNQQRDKLRKCGILQRFSVIAISGDMGCVKPAPEIFHAACKAAGEEPGTCLYIGDDFDADAIGSRRAGMTGLWLNRGNSSRADEEPTITTLIALTKWMELHNHRIHPTSG